MENILNNTAKAVGKYNNIPTSITSSASVVTIVTGLTITKEADQQIWADNSLLTYIITISNQTDQIYESPTVTDNLDNLIEFVEGSVTINEIETTTGITYDENNNILTIELSDISVNGTTIIKFKVKKK